MSNLPNRRDALLTLLAGGWVVCNAGRGHSQDAGVLTTSDVELRLLFFNAHLLPAVAQSIAGHRGQDDYRTRAIAAHLHRYDLVGLCEVFEARRRQEIIRVVQEASDDAYSWVETPKPSGRHLVSGGLLLLTRWAIEGEPHVHIYSSASRIYNTGLKADGLAAKAVIHARLRPPGAADALVDCFLTHLESVSATARAVQIKELAEFLAEHSATDRPLILMGDLNVTAEHPASAAAAGSEYRLLADSLRHGATPLIDLWPALQAGRGGTSDALAGEECRRIDYLFISPAMPGSQVRLEPSAIRVEPFLDPNVKQGSLSDHSGLECRLTLRR